MRHKNLILTILLAAMLLISVTAAAEEDLGDQDFDGGPEMEGEEQIFGGGPQMEGDEKEFRGGPQSGQKPGNFGGGSDAEKEDLGPGSAHGRRPRRRYRRQERRRVSERTACRDRREVHTDRLSG